MTKSTSAPHVGCLALNRRSLNLRNKSHSYMIQRNSQLIEVTVNASERIVHLRTPNETTVGKIMDSCIKMLNLTEDKSLFTLKEKQGSLDLPADQQIGSLLTSDKRQLELCLHKTGKKASSAAVNGPNMNENGSTDTNVQEDQSAREERMKELHQQVDSLHNVISQVQELHQSLVEFCAELKNMDKDADVELLGSVELKQRLESVSGRLSEKRQSLQCLKNNVNTSAVHHSKQLDVQLLEKMKFNCQVFKEEITIVHLSRRVVHLQHALQETKEKARNRSLAIHSLSQLVAPNSSAMFLVLEENQVPEGHYGFTCSYTEDRGLVVVEVENTELHVDDRLVEVNGTPVLNYTLEELTDLLQQGPRAQIVVLRQPPPTLPHCQEHLVSADSMQITRTRSDAVTMETLPRRKVVAI
ncbi:uncharacterized protein LOC112487852 [Cynoglossus semilaevis]|uniref:uncharacterized protein LOC112487852 n=1 Tax=Cynoglossus semilaevis TaxID=244447 RepID=UPI000D62EF78|nr:uncharacterized protein LOC112487852 [Cynoglossus semilaevis]